MLRKFKILLILLITTALLSSLALSGQCQATTKKGTQCKRQAAAGSSYCWQHGGSSSTKATTVINDSTTIKQSDSKKTQPVTTRCQAITKKGTQCKRNAQAGSSYCWQHK